ncbi:lymphocyte antigen 6E [Zootoca vivipara]|uniref:lymphocyte antigen 6E n=1 Tax=Zootoca vivipara TaxID=8524 RepID=UPI00159201FA|nr:lymphocyte antigen 6E [Zootoca vivipara]
MKTLLVALLVAILCAGKAHSFFCYRCENEPSNWNCLKAVKCSEQDQFCTTITSTSGTGKNAVYQLSKRCTPTCTENFMDTGLTSVSTKCCNSSFCNISGATSVKTSGLLMAVGVLASFFYIFQSVL